jgi:hypothetical protein
MWNDPDSVRQLAKVATWLTAIFGLLAAISAITQIVADRRAQSLDEQLKKTPPAISVKAALESPTLVKLAIAVANLVPFECQWLTCTATNQVVGSLPIDWRKIVPTKTRRLFLAEDHIHPSKVHDGPLHVRFKFRSVHAAEVGERDLQGTMVFPVLRPGEGDG